MPSDNLSQHKNGLKKTFLHHQNCFETYPIFNCQNKRRSLQPIPEKWAELSEDLATWITQPL